MCDMCSCCYLIWWALYFSTVKPCQTFRVAGGESVWGGGCVCVSVCVWVFACVSLCVSHREGVTERVREKERERERLIEWKLFSLWRGTVYLEQLSKWILLWTAERDSPMLSFNGFYMCVFKSKVTLLSVCYDEKTCTIALWLVLLWRETVAGSY